MEKPDRIVDVEIIIRVDGHRLCFEAQRNRQGDTEPERTADTSRAVSTALTDATSECLAHVGRAYPLDSASNR